MVRTMLSFLVALFYLPLLIQLSCSQSSPLEIYQILTSKYFGRDMFEMLIWVKSPYTNSISPQVEHFCQNKCQVSLTEKTCLRNSFRSVHAMALANLGEFTAGLLMLEYLHQHHLRGIVTSINCKYYKKARGKITAHASLDCIPPGNSTYLIAKLFDNTGQLVGEIGSYWEFTKGVKKNVNLQ